MSAPPTSEVSSSSSSSTSSSCRILRRMFFFTSKAYSLFKRLRGCLLSKSFFSFSKLFHKRVKGYVFEISICLQRLKIIGVCRIKCFEKSNKREISSSTLVDLISCIIDFTSEARARGSLFFSSRVKSYHELNNFKCKMWVIEFFQLL